MNTIIAIIDNVLALEVGFIIGLFLVVLLEKLFGR